MSRDESAEIEALCPQELASKVRETLLSAEAEGPWYGADLVQASRLAPDIATDTIRQLQSQGTEISRGIIKETFAAYIDASSPSARGQKESYQFAEAICRALPSVDLIEVLSQKDSIRARSGAGGVFLLEGGAKVAFQFSMSDGEKSIAALIDHLSLRNDSHYLLDRAIDYGLGIHDLALKITSRGLNYPDSALEKKFVAQCVGSRHPLFKTHLADVIDLRFKEIGIDIADEFGQQRAWLLAIRDRLRASAKMSQVASHISMSAP